MANGDAGDIAGVSHVRDKILKIYRDIKLNGHSRSNDFSIGRVERRMREFAGAYNIELASQHMYMAVRNISHSVRDSKTIDGMAVPIEKLASFPKNKGTMDLYWDGDVFVYTDYEY